MTPLQQKQIRLAGIVGILAALAAAVADISLQYSPTGQYGTLLEFLHIPPWRLLLGHYIGIFAIPLLAAGYWQIAQALKPAGKWFSLPFFFITAYSVAYGTAFHGLSTGVELIVQARQHAPAATQAALTSLLNTTFLFTRPLAIVLLVNYLIGCTWYVIAVLFRRTLLPKWMALFNPFVLSLLIVLFYYSNLLPPLGNLLFPAVLNIPHVIFFTLSTILLWNVSSQVDDISALDKQKQATSISS